MSTADSIEIIGGGNKFDLFAQMFNWGRVLHVSKDHRELFDLELKSPTVKSRRLVSAEITGIEHRSRGTQFKITGFIIPSDVQGCDWLREFAHRQFVADYNTRARKGSLEPRFPPIV